MDFCLLITLDHFLHDPLPVLSATEINQIYDSEYPCTERYGGDL